MTPSEFVKNKLNELILVLPTARARYEYDVQTNTHFIEITPLSLYNTSEDYKKLERNIILQFIKWYPSETISFISDDAVVGLDRVDYEVVNNELLKQLEQ